jgi:hypothetical protein
MRTSTFLIASLIALSALPAGAAVKDHKVKYLQSIYQDGILSQQARHDAFGFRVEIVSDNEGTKGESTRHGRPFVTAQSGERYSVRLYNPLPVRVAVNLTVDGLNSISGKPSGISDGEKWVIDPFSSVTIPGWQVSGGEARRFFFTEKHGSYAKWRGDMTGKDLAANCGVIGAAYFWSQSELDQYYAQHPIYRYTQNYYPYDKAVRSKSSADTLGSASGAPAPSMARNDFQEEKKEQAGTGMGERESHPTYEVDFRYDTGMYNVSQAVVIYYDFDHKPSPNPFPDMSFAPEQP